MRNSRRARSNRSGFSVLELLVVMGVISLLVALLLPAAMRTRASSRRLACLNHLRQISLAVTMHTDQNGRFPAAGLFAGTGTLKYHNWVTSLLPQLDQSGLYQQYEFAKSYSDPVNFKLTRTPLPVLACPDDISVVQGEGNLSYVVNGGIGWTIPIDCPASVHSDDEQVTIAPLDLNGNGIVCPLEAEPGPGISDLSHLEMLSLFFVENWPEKSGTQRFQRPRDVTDGMSTTMMLAENVRAGYDPQATTSWGSPEPLRTMFFVSSAVCPDGQCLSDKIDLSLANSRNSLPASRECLNSSLTQAEGTAPWPSSGHAGLVHVAWCDGHVSALSEFVDGQVYFALVTPRGAENSLFGEQVITSQHF